MSDYLVRPLGPDTWDAFAALAERHNGVWGGCWCTFFHPTCPERGQSQELNRGIKQRLVTEGVAHAALVFDGDRAVAWCEYGTPEELPNVQHNKQYLAELDILRDTESPASSWTAATVGRVWPASRSTAPWT